MDVHACGRLNGRKGGGVAVMFANVQKLVIPEGEVVKISHGTTVLWERPGLPLAYQQVEYIQTDGNQYIDTGVLASDYPDGLEYVFEGYCTAESASRRMYMFGCLFGEKRSGNAGIESTLKASLIFLGTSGTGNIQINITKNERFTLWAKGTSESPPDFTASWNGVKYNNVSFTSYSCNMPSANIFLLACNLNGGYTSGSSMPYVGKLYSFTMADMDGIEIRNFVPCYRKSDGVIGLYDTVGSTFYTNKGTGSFTKGADV
ncbi:MAG: hypothetical protein IKU40_04925 [Clostridia bacterium]|nr:hypothetical protein [Clostridia bacterium]